MNKLNNKITKDVHYQQTFSLHAHLCAFHKPTVLAIISGEFIDDTTSFIFTGVYQVLLDTSFEESLTSFTGKNRIMVARPPVITNHAGRGIGWRVFSPCVHLKKTRVNLLLLTLQNYTPVLFLCMKFNYTI